MNVPAFDTLYEAACCPSYSEAGYFNTPRLGGSVLMAQCALHPLAGRSKCPLDAADNLYLPPGHYMADHTCDPKEMLGETVYKSSPFDCTALPICEVSCGGPNPAVVDSVCKSCSCMTEWLFNSYVFQIALAICVYLILNVSRVLLCKGVVMVVWRSLTREEFEVRVACSRSGNMMFAPLPASEAEKEREEREGEETAEREGRLRDDRAEREESESGGDCVDFGRSASKGSVGMRDKQSSSIRDDIEHMLSRFVMRGYVYIAMGVLLNVGWLTAVSYVQSNLTYKPT